MDLAYEGTGYHGFGIQPRRLTIQKVLEDALGAALGDPIRVTPAGRTDAGVHASGQVVSFRTRGSLGAEALARAANARLPDDVLVEHASEAPTEFDARRAALRRHYRYTVWNRPVRGVWQRRWSWHVPVLLDVAAMERAARMLVGRHDFAAFAGQAAHEPLARSTVRTVERAAWRRDDGRLLFDITADAFLRHMVRGIVGTLVRVGQGRLDAEQIGEIIASSDRRHAGPNAPPAGLMLTGVDYPEQYDLTRAPARHPEPVSHPDPIAPVDRNAQPAHVAALAFGERA